QLGYITNSTDGYVSFKETSLQDSIDSYDTQISQMNDALARKKDMLTNKYVAMEVALESIKNQSTWLTSQISALSTTW
ncbi:MAG: hypothetical protein L7F78_21440, partial [Syntrophales bacterium LBB04]|nr:hypothetical protein [Syntrophales bacterium LBB04]